MAFTGPQWRHLCTPSLRTMRRSMMATQCHARCMHTHVSKTRFLHQDTSARLRPATVVRHGGRCSAEGNDPTHDTPLYASFMGSSTRFAAEGKLLTREVLTALEKEPLLHCPPGQVSDHLCVAMVKSLRWCADRLFHERHVHRASMLLPIASAGPAAAAVVGYLRKMIRPKHCSIADAFYPSQTPTPSGTDSSASPAQPPQGEDEFQLHQNYAAQMRGLLSQTECHAMHYQIVLHMADRVGRLEQLAVVVLQAIHFFLCAIIFLLRPRMGFRLLGYMAEESIVVWTQMVNDVDLGKVSDCRVPLLATRYWAPLQTSTLQEPIPTATAPRDTWDTTISKSSGRGLTVRDVALLIRADLTVYGELNHRMADELDRAALETRRTRWWHRFVA